MVAIERISLSHLPPDVPIYVALYRGVANAGFLREQLMAGNEAFEFAFVDAGMIISRQHALAAVFRAMNDYLNERLKSRNVHSEIVFALSSNNNIGEAFRRFGVSDTTKDLLVFKVATTPDVSRENVQRHLDENVKGEAVPFDDEQLRDLTDLARLKKVHKLGAGESVRGGKKTKVVVNGGGVGGGEVVMVDERKEVEVQVLGLMALRGAT